ncbi:hypothetical protein GGX14DRAFT_565629 [Mycena pura]|uniref:Uncharacterized protein n=1 Tax=Mycena pura TaxID=153505 RepID=A0AAD6VIA3_9AGAR|nr:hypothetical protein GGX14DRAFT_565629 [Mycena pura]
MLPYHHHLHARRPVTHAVCTPPPHILWKNTGLSGEDNPCLTPRRCISSGRSVRRVVLDAARNRRPDPPAHTRARAPFRRHKLPLPGPVCRLVFDATRRRRPDPPAHSTPQAVAARTPLRTLQRACTGSCLTPRAAAARTCPRTCAGPRSTPRAAAAAARARRAHAPTSVRRLATRRCCPSRPAHARARAPFRRHKPPPHKPALHTLKQACTGSCLTPRAAAALTRLCTLAGACGFAVDARRRRPRRPRAAALQRAAPCRARPRHARARGFAFAPCDAPTPCDAPAPLPSNASRLPSNAPAPRRCPRAHGSAQFPVRRPPLPPPRCPCADALQRPPARSAVPLHARARSRECAMDAHRRRPATPPCRHPPTPHAAALQRHRAVALQRATPAPLLAHVRRSARWTPTVAAPRDAPGTPPSDAPRRRPPMPPVALQRAAPRTLAEARGFRTRRAPPPPPRRPRAAALQRAVPRRARLRCTRPRTSVQFRGRRALPPPHPRPPRATALQRAAPCCARPRMSAQFCVRRPPPPPPPRRPLRRRSCAAAPLPAHVCGSAVSCRRPAPRAGFDARRRCHPVLLPCTARACSQERARARFRCLPLPLCTTVPGFQRPAPLSSPVHCACF